MSEVLNNPAPTVLDDTSQDREAEQRAEVEEAVRELKPILELDDDLFAEASHGYIEFKIAALESEAMSDYVGLPFGVRSTNKFLGSKTEISSLGFGRSYFIDDPSVHDHLMTNLRRNYQKMRSQNSEISDIRAVYSAGMHAAEQSQRGYFGNKQGSNQAERDRKLADYVDDDYDAPAIFSIKDMKDIPMCMERAAVEHNLLKVLGFPSRLELGTLLTDSGERRTREAHAFIRTCNSEGEDRIVDPQNPKIIDRRAMGGGRTAQLAIYAMPTDSRDDMTVTKSDTVYDEAGQKMTRDIKLTYQFSPTETFDLSRPKVG